MSLNGFVSGMRGLVKPRSVDVSKRLLDVRIYYGPNQWTHRGVKEFVYRLLPEFRRHNPTAPVIVNPHYILPEVPEAWILGRYEQGRQKKYKLTNRSSEQVLVIVEDFARGGRLAGGGLPDIPQRGLILMPTEQKNSNPFKIISKKL